MYVRDCQQLYWLSYGINFYVVFVKAVVDPECDILSDYFRYTLNTVNSLQDGPFRDRPYCPSYSYCLLLIRNHKFHETRVSS